MTRAAEAATDRSIWAAVDRLVDRAPGDDDLGSHRLEVLAARRRRALGEPVPEPFRQAERLAALAQLTAPPLLERVLAAWGGPLLVLKGPETAALYPDPSLRGFDDLDVLVEDAPAAHAALVGAGFVPVGDPELYRGIHHLRPLACPGLPLTVEVHARPKWLDGRAAPSAADLLAGARPSIAAPGALAVPPAEHAVLLAVHSWAHEPLRRLRDLVDVAAARAACAPGEPAAVAEAWGVARLWRVTEAAVEALLCGGREPWALRLWAQNLGRVRERTVLEQHLQRWLSDFAALPFAAAARRVPRSLLAELAPEGDEGWRAKVLRSGLALRDARRPRSYHDRVLERRSLRR